MSRAIASRCRFLVALLCALAQGCGAEPSQSCAAAPSVDCTTAHADSPALEVGTGDEQQLGFVPIPDDGSLPLAAGPQHGYHVYLQVKARGLCPSPVILEVEIRADGEIVRGQSERTALVDGPDGTWILPRALVTFVCPPPLDPGVALAGRPLDFHVALTEASCGEPLANARSSAADLRITPTCPEGDEVCERNGSVGCAAP